MISPKYFLFGLSGVGVTAGGLTIWQFTKGDKHQKLDTKHEFDQDAEKQKASSYETEIDETCGEDIWYNSKNPKNHNELNSKQNNSNDYLECINKMRYRT